MLVSPENYVYHRLVSTPAVARLVGFQVFAMAVPKSATFPFIVYKRANIAREGTMTGVSLFMPMVSLQIASWGLTYDGARQLADEVRLALDNNTGTAAGATIQDMRLVSETDDFLDPTAVGAQLPPAYEVRQLYQIRWQESAS